MLDEDQRALVTGAGSGIGRAIARALAAQGLNVIFCGRQVLKLREASEGAGSNTSILAADLTIEADRARLAAETGPRLDVLVHCSGQYLRAEVETLTPARWQALDAINLHAPILLTAACLPQLRAATGQVVFINSSAAASATTGLAAYAAGKRGLQAAADILRQEINADQIRVLSVFPGRTDTPMQQAILHTEQRVAPAGALIRPEDVAAMVVSALALPRSVEVTDIFMRPMRRL